jgi:hypothetical protein
MGLLRICNYVYIYIYLYYVCIYNTYIHILSCKRVVVGFTVAAIGL